MAKLLWDQSGQKTYETGVKKGVLYLAVAGAYPKGVAWNGLTKVTESPSGAEATSLYADDTKYLSLMSAEEFGCTIEAYTYPKEFEACDGLAEISDGISVGQQKRSTFGFCYRTGVGNDTDGDEYGYKIHLVYGCQASPSSKDYSSVNDSREVMSLSWEVKTTPVPVEGLKSSATLVIDSTKIDADALKKIEDALYGTETEDAHLPLPNEIKALIAAA